MDRTPSVLSPVSPQSVGNSRSNLVPNADIGVVISVISSGFSTDPRKVLVPTRAKADIALTRQISMYVAHVALGLSLTEVGRKFGRDRTTAAHACRLVEDRRDDLQFDFLLDHLEAATLKLARLALRQ